MGEKRAKKNRKRKAKKRQKHLKVLNRVSKPRECGDCGECCIHFAVRGLPGHDEVKPVGTPCMHLVDTPNARCGLYGEDRPKVCGAYKCLWLWDSDQKNRKFMADERPDQFGVIFDLTAADHPATQAIGRPVMIAKAVREGVFEELATRKTIGRFVKEGHVVALLRGEEYEFVSLNQLDAFKVSRAYQNLPGFKVLS